jgi:hypothetical protein
MKRHVWCNVRHQLPPSPGLLLDWRKDAAGDWEALVIVMTQSNAHKDFDGTATVWVPACNLSPVIKD